MQENNEFVKEFSDDDFKPQNEDVIDNEFKTIVFSKNVEDNNGDKFEESIEENIDNFDDEYDDEYDDENRGMPGFVRYLVIFSVSVFFAVMIILSIVDFLGLTFFDNKTYEIDVKSGYSTEQIAKELDEKGVIRFSTLFRIYSKIAGGDGTYKFGFYEIKDSQSYGSIISTLQQPGASGEIASITIPEGSSVNEIAKLMEENGVCSIDEFINAVKTASYDYDFIDDIPTQSVYYRLEGYLYPDTYHFYKNTDGESGASCAEKAVRKMIEKMQEVVDGISEKAALKGKSVHEILTMASIVELEASGYPNDMAKVSQVFYNRLRWTDQPAWLGSTPTAEYPDKRYDTNSNEGLPPGPLCSPSADAINAALNPDTSIKSEYFVTDKNMKFYYTNSLEEHDELIERLKSEGLWN